MLNYENAILFAQRGFLFSETLAQIQDGNNLAAQIDHALQIVGRIGHGSNLRYPYDFVQGSDGNSVGLTAHLEAHDMKFTAHMFKLCFQAPGSRSGFRLPTWRLLELRAGRGTAGVGSRDLDAG